QKTTLNLWNNQKIKYIVATNAFGMGVHALHVRTIIHTTFPLSPTNFVQEVGRAGRDGQSAESLVLYACADIRELLMIVDTKPDSLEMLAVRRRREHLDRSKKKIFAMAYTFEESYQCQDPEISECGACDNCIRHITDNIIWCDISIDLLRILDTVDKLLRFTNDLETQLVTFGRNDIVDVFIKANNKNTREKNLTSLWTNESDDMNNDTVNILIQTKSMCLHAIDRLCLEGILAQKVIIKPMWPGSLALVYTSNISEIAPNARQKIGKKLWLEAFKPSKKRTDIKQ
ncbi:16811_t:CDS:2, partial [Racocetra fulgida]